MPNFPMMANNVPQNPMVGQFQNFMQQMRGQNPTEIINNLVRSGRISQQQLNQVQAQARQMGGIFNSLRGMFGF